MAGERAGCRALGKQLKIERASREAREKCGNLPSKIENQDTKRTVQNCIERNKLVLPPNAFRPYPCSRGYGRNALGGRTMAAPFMFLQDPGNLIMKREDLMEAFEAVEEEVFVAKRKLSMLKHNLGVEGGKLLKTLPTSMLKEVDGEEVGGSDENVGQKDAYICGLYGH
ncbi:hypothetical protein NDU88_005469 [Pleurodeles waltl]|uniref:P53 and DNA damage-regulated protein 1 n=1 Tax=Pleurodeles waltl TaxID=8319 RepID=A0AAV7WUT4_PLEWA|nr:hypothetical protein NDU88_005469 [Pleurodeles waltl]